MQAYELVEILSKINLKWQKLNADGFGERNKL